MPKDIILKKCFVDELGFSNLKSNAYEPTYNYYKKGDKIIVRVEVPGNSKIESNIEYLGECSQISLRGIKKNDKEPEKLEDNIYNSREFGNFYLNIYLKAEEYLLKNEQPSITKKNGIIFLEYQLTEKNNKADYETKSDEEI
jgi:HSP20 family molecular chaperone IbpA